jgi:CO/xanthine dehydrogenase FAD-binding subunit
VKPVAFQYAAPDSVPEALALLAGEEAAVVLAGGQSLVPMLNFRLARPALVVDINGLQELERLEADRDGLRIGALTRQAAVERSAVVSHGWPLLTQAVALVGHPAIRSRGTVGGSAAHADPRAELPAALIALDARFHCRSPSGERIVSAERFFVGPIMTALAPGELLVEISVPSLPAGAATGFAEHARTHGDFASAAAAVVLVPGAQASIVVLGAGPGPVRAVAAQAAFVAGAQRAEVARLAGEMAGDDYRRALVTAVVGQAMVEALQPR